MPVLPSAFWHRDVREFVRDMKPPLLDQFHVVIVDDEEGACMSAASRLQAPAATGLLVWALCMWCMVWAARQA